MRSNAPPAVATWLLQCFVSGSRGESLLGDAIEQYRNGRSRVWYWRQVVGAIAAEAVEEVRHRPLVAARALMLGWTLRWIGKYFSGTLQSPGRFASVQIGNWLLTTGHDSLRFWWFNSQACLLPGWSMWWIACAGIGWTISY